MAPSQYLTGDAAAVKEFLSKFDTFLFDCDGVLWSGDHLFEGIRETLQMLRDQGKRLVFVTNNSTKSRRAYKSKFDSMSIPVSAEDIFGSSYSAAIYISRILLPSLPALPSGRPHKTFILGESGVAEELSSEGLSYVGGPDPALNRDMTPEDFETIASGEALDPDVSVVLSGLDFHVNYLKLSLAFAYLQRGARFLATNGDSTLPNAKSLFPGAGSVGAPLVKAYGKEPLQLGKPSQAMMEAIEGKFKLDRKKTCMVGDRLGTDIAFGIEGGLGGTLCVLTGVSQKEEFLQQDAQVVPMAYADQLSDLLAGK